MKKLFFIAAMLVFLSPLAVHAQASTLTATVTYCATQVAGACATAAPTPPQCTSTVTKNCIYSWRIFNTTGGIRTALFDVLASQVATWTGSVTASASGSIPPVIGAGTAVADTVGHDSNGNEVLSSDSPTATFAVAPNGVTITILTVGP